MPNHIENHLTIEGPISEIEAFKAKAAGPDSEGNAGERVITLHAFIPMPKNIHRGNLTLEEQRATKGLNWYDWSIKHWGTKWDCYDTTFKVVTDHVLDQMAKAISAKGEKAEVFGKVLYTFQTAWSAPMPVIEAMAKQHPELKFKHEWSDEDTHGSNHGRQTYENGAQTEYKEFAYEGDDTSPELEELATRLHGRNPYLPRCEFCGDDLSEAEIKKFGVVRREGCCETCKPKYDKANKYPLEEEAKRPVGKKRAKTK